jgi:3-isopropylmalate dehydratase small subunit
VLDFVAPSGNLMEQTGTKPSNSITGFDITLHRKRRLQNGLDEIGLTQMCIDQNYTFDAQEKNAQALQLTRRWVT